MSQSIAHTVTELESLLDRLGISLDTPPVVLAGDGSSRRFFRLRTAAGERLVAVLPADRSPARLAEVRSTVEIGRHLRACGVPVPAIVGADPDSGLVVFEDLGDMHLADWLQQPGRSRPEIEACYQRLIDILIHMQVHAAPGMAAVFCHQGRRYDRAVMLERESYYFLDAFVRRLLELAPPAGIEAEFEELADSCAALAGDFFLHRDFQSRNIMVTENGGLWVIDFQAGRLGPPGYDLAALVRDPYAGLDRSLRRQLLEAAIDALAERVPLDRHQWRRGFFLLALQRNLQVLGAFAFLGHQRHKPGFLPYIPRGVALLEELLTEELAGCFPKLTLLVARIVGVVKNKEWS